MPFKEAWLASSARIRRYIYGKERRGREGGSERGGIRPNVARASPRQSHCQCKKANDRERDGRRQPAKIVIGGDLGGPDRQLARSARARPPARPPTTFSLFLSFALKKRATSDDNETKRMMHAPVRGMGRCVASLFDSANEKGHGRERT